MSEVHVFQSKEMLMEKLPDLADQPKNLDMLRRGWDPSEIDAQQAALESPWTTEELWFDWVEKNIPPCGVLDHVLDYENFIFAFRDKDKAVQWEKDFVDSFSSEKAAPVNGEYLYIRKQLQVRDEVWTVVTHISIFEQSLPENLEFVKGKGIKVSREGESYMVDKPLTCMYFQEPCMGHSYFAWFEPGASILRISDVHEAAEIASIARSFTEKKRPYTGTRPFVKKKAKSSHRDR